MRAVTIVFLLVLLGQPLFAEEAKHLESPAATRALADQLSTLFGKSDFDQTFALAKSHWAFRPEEIDNLKMQTSMQLSSVKPRFGSVIGSEFLAAHPVGESLIFYTYLIKCERHALRLRFAFYSPKPNVWLLNSFLWDDTISELESLRSAQP